MNNEEYKMIFKFKNQYNNIKPNPILELYKGKLYIYIIKSFINSCVKTFGKEIFSKKKSYSRTLTNILSSWIFSLYITYDYSEDYFFPSNYDNTDLLEEILKDYIKYDTTITDTDNKITNVLSNLKKVYGLQLKLLDIYKKSNYYFINKHNYKITKNELIINNKKFIKFIIKYPFIINNSHLLNILNNIIIPEYIYIKLSNRYTGEYNQKDVYIWNIIYRYQLLSSNNHQLGVLPKIMKQMNVDYNLNFECFASAINCTCSTFCSIYYDLERYFGSVGSFFNIIPIEGTFGFNPPYQKDIITIGITKLLDYLETTKKLIFIITIPIWDDDGKMIMKQLYDNEFKKQNIIYEKFDIMDKINNSKFLKSKRMISKEEFTYLDHNFDIYKNKTIQNTYVIILSNYDIDVSYFEKYNYKE
jgi:hypothetical protein